jgi:hypothetical protein
LAGYDAPLQNANRGGGTGVVRTIFLFLRAFITTRSVIAAENLALRQQLGVLQRSVKRARLRRRDRILWVWLSRLWSDWRSSLLVVKPETVIRWHREGFKLYWRWKSRSKPGRSTIDTEVRQLIRRMSLENPL